MTESNNGHMMILSDIDPKIKPRALGDLVNVPKNIVVNKFDEESAKKFYNDITEAMDTGQKIIPIFIDSFGGVVYSLLSMVDMINKAKKHGFIIATISLSKSMSCGSVLFTQGTEGHRYISPLSTIMIHDVSSATWGKIEDMKADTKEAERLDTMIYKLLSTSIGKPENYFKEIVHTKGHADWYMTAEQAVEHNLANHIGVPSFKVTVDVDIKFE